MSGCYHDAFSITLFQPDNQSHILGLPTPSSTFLPLFVRQTLLVKVDCLGCFALESVRAVHDNQTMYLAPPFGVDKLVGRQSSS